MKNSLRKKEIIISGPSFKGHDPDIQLLRITLNKFETKIDFGYKASEYYIRGGWIKISPETFIRPSNSQQKFILTKADHIPYGPERHHFNSTIEWKYFSLYFPPLPEDVDEIDVIELETKMIDPTQFNFYHVRLDEVNKQFRLA